MEYLGHIITLAGVHPNPKLVSDVKEYPTPQSVQKVLELCITAGSHTHTHTQKLLSHFANSHVRAPSTCSSECQTSFDEIMSRLVSSLALVYLSLDRDFILKMDASIQGLGAVLSQKQDDSSTHPAAFVRRALSSTEKRHRITELETLAIVWAISHFHYYLCVMVYTEHTTVKAVLGSPSLSGRQVNARLIQGQTSTLLVEDEK